MKHDFDILNEQLKITNEEFSATLLLCGSNSRIDEEKILSVTKLHFCIWKNRMALKDEYDHLTYTNFIYKSHVDYENLE